MKALHSTLKAIFTWLAFYLFSLHAVAQPSGDIIVDSFLYGYPQTGGNSSAPGSLHPNNYGLGQYHYCNSPVANSWEQNCPSDLLYTPNANTGGYQAFGAGLARYYAGSQYILYCYYDFYYDPNGEVGGVYPTCYLVGVVNWPAQTLGVAASRIEFGGMLVDAGPSWGMKPMSTMAFKANNVYVPHIYSFDCNPTMPWPPYTIPCDSALPNVFAVPDVGYEDKVRIKEYNCIPQGLYWGALSGRNGSLAEAQQGCFIYDSGWYSDLPSAYRDVLVLDGPLYFVPAIGTPSPIGIQEGQRYVWAADFYQFGVETFDPTRDIQHRSQVTTWNALGVGVGSCPAACYFGVDQTTIAPASVLP